MPSQQSLVGQNLFKELLKKVISGKEQESSGKKSKVRQDKVKEGRSMAKAKPKSAAGKSKVKPAPTKKPATKSKPSTTVTAKAATPKTVTKESPRSKPVANTPAPKAPVAKTPVKPVLKTDAKAPVKAPVKAPAKTPATKSPAVAVSPKSTMGKVAPLTSKAAPKPTPTIMKSPAKAAHDEDEAPTSPKRMGISTDIFSEEELTQFRNMLNEEKRKILAKAKMATASGNIALEKDEMYDEVDLASATVEQNLTLRLLDRDRKLLAEIDHAIDKIDTGDYGFCEGTGEVIPKRRLELRPWTRHSVKYKEQLERMKKSGRGVADEDETF